MRTHPPTLLTVTRRALEEHELVQRGDHVLVAVSGGPDSMALLHVLALLRDKVGYRVSAHGVDHGLRAGAAAELDLAEGFAGTLEVPFGRTSVEVAPGGNLQERAREARFEALGTAARRAGCTRIATAHHADDRAETVLMRILRGAGPAGLAVLPPRGPHRAGAPDLVRPFIGARRDAIHAHLARHRVPFALDPSNADPRFLRARVRSELLPLLSSLSPSVVDHLCALADQLGRNTPDPLAGFPRATRLALSALGQKRTQDRTKARVFLGSGLVARFDKTQLNVVVESSVLSPAPSPAPPAPETAAPAGASEPMQNRKRTKTAKRTRNNK